MAEGEGITAGTEGTPTESTSLGDIAARAAESLEPSVESGQATGAPAPETTANQAPAAGEEPGQSDDGGEAGEAGAAASEDPQAQTLELLKQVDWENPSDELIARLGGQESFEVLKTAYKSMQADYTRKTQKVAEIKGFSEEETERLRAIIAQEGQQQPTGAAPEAAPDRAGQLTPERVQAWLYEGLGEPLTFQQVIASENANDLDRYFRQLAQVAARTETFQFSQAVLPTVQQLQAQYGARDVAEANEQITTFFAANPDLEAHRESIGALIAAGKSLEEAGAFVRAATTRDQAVAQATTAAIQLGREQAKQVQDNQAAFSVPSSTTAPAGPSGVTPEAAKDLSLKQIAERAIAK